MKICLKLCVIVLILLLSQDLYAGNKHRGKFYKTTYNLITSKIRITEKSNVENKLVFEGGCKFKNGIISLRNYPYKYKVEDLYSLEKETNYTNSGFFIAYSVFFLGKGIVDYNDGKSLVPAAIISIIPGIIGGIIGSYTEGWEDVDLKQYKKKDVSVSLLPVYNPSINFTGLNLSVSF